MQGSKIISIICDNARIGGIQRLALDQAYYFSDIGFKVNLLFMTDMSEANFDSFLNRELHQISQRDISILFLGRRRNENIANLVKYAANANSRIYICHSLRASVTLYVYKQMRRLNFDVVSCIHQLPGLSAPIQRYRRILYARLSDRLFGYSFAVVHEWNKIVENNPFLRIFYSGRHMRILRNGVYLNRVNQNKKNETIKEICFVGRITNWKGFDTFLKIARIDTLKDWKIKIAIPYIDSILENQLNQEFSGRIEILVGKTFSELSIGCNSFLIYPVNYKVEGAIESVSINVLECISVGAKCLVTEGGCQTWPELETSGRIIQINWNETAESIANRLIISSINEDTPKLDYLREVVDIKNNCISILGSSNSNSY